MVVFIKACSASKQRQNCQIIINSQFRTWYKLSKLIFLSWIIRSPSTNILLIFYFKNHLNYDEEPFLLCVYTTISLGSCWTITVNLRPSVPRLHGYYLWSQEAIFVPLWFLQSYNHDKAFLHAKQILLARVVTHRKKKKVTQECFPSHLISL